MPDKFLGRRPDGIGSVYTSRPCSRGEARPVPACVTWARLGNEFGSFGPAHGQSVVALEKKNSAVVGTDLKFLCDTFILHAESQPSPLISRSWADLGGSSIFSFLFTQLEQELWCFCYYLDDAKIRSEE